MNIAIIIFILTALIFATQARPWNMTGFEGSVEIVPQFSSPLIQTLDSMTAGFSSTLRSVSPSLAPILGLTSLAYVGYVGAVMYFPKTLKDVGVPVLSDFKIESRATRKTSENPSFIDSLATGFMRDMIMRTTAAAVLRNTSIDAVKSSMGTLQRTTKFLTSELNLFQRTVNRISTALDPKCLARYMCQVGQFTKLHVPALGPALRSFNTFDLDEYTQALIDGTTVGDCKAVYYECPL